MQLQRPEAGLLAAPGFLKLWTAGSIANAVRWLEVLTAGLFTLEATGSGLMVALVTAGRSLPLIFMSGMAGVVSDAFNRKYLLVAGMLLMATSSGAVCVLSLLGWLNPWHMLVAGLVTGTVYGTEMPVRRRMVGESVPTHLVARAVAFDSVSSSLTRVAGPLLGGVAYEWAGITATFAVTAVMGLIAALIAAQVSWPQVTRALSPSAAIRELAEGVAFVRRTPALLTLLGVTVTMNVFGFSYTSLMAPVGEAVFHVSPSLVGVLAAAEPAGASLGGVLMTTFGLPRGNPVWQLLSGVGVFLFTLALLPFAGGYWAACGLMLIGGLGVSVFSNLQTTVGLSEAPFAMRSRVMGLIATCIGSWPLGMLLAGFVADRMGPVGALAALGSTGLAVLAAVGGLYARRRLTAPVS